ADRHRLRLRPRIVDGHDLAAAQDERRRLLRARRRRLGRLRPRPDEPRHGHDPDRNDADAHTLHREHLMTFVNFFTSNLVFSTLLRSITVATESTREPRATCAS